jgi:hypothetical protein
MGYAHARVRPFAALSGSLFLLVAVAGCARRPALFLAQNARAHVNMLAGTIGSRPVGTPANARARAYIIDQLKLFGYEVRTQETDARRDELGRTARVANIIGVLQGSRTEAMGIVSHYDSAPEAPGATDDALGVGVVLEAARVHAARAGRQWTLMVLVTDAEEAGLMGAAALITDSEVTRRLQAYINVDSVGSSGTAVLFETGPGNGWLLAPWVRHAPHPRGASFGVEIYRHLPNDTDFSIIKRRDIPGLNFAPVSDSYAYHTARDTPERLSDSTIRETGENVTSILAALDAIDITRRSVHSSTYFDIGGTTALSFGPAVRWILAIGALILGVVSWVKFTRWAIASEGFARWLLTVMWSILGAAAVVFSMIAATWALRAAREVYHPWYARPDRLFALLVTVGTTTAWTAARLGHWLPRRAHGLRHPAITWTVALPVWIALAGSTLWFAPGAVYLWALPLLSAGLLLSMISPKNEPAVRAASVVVLGVTATLWLHESLELLRFVVTVFGRLPTITPVFVYASGVSAAGVMIVPPLIAASATPRPLLRPSLVTALCLIATAVAAGVAYSAPAYTFEQPLRRYVRALQETAEGPAAWEVGSVEPGLDLRPTAPGGWAPPPAGSPGSVVGKLRHPFVFRTNGPPLGPPPVAIGSVTEQPVTDGVELSVTVVPRQPGVTVSFILPEGVMPARSNLAGTQRLGRWAATYVALPPDGVAFRAGVGAAHAGRLRDLKILATTYGFPTGTGWQALPEWLPQEFCVWSGAASWVLSLQTP